MKHQEINQLDVFLWGERIGKLAIDEFGIGYFKYDDNFISKGIDPSPIFMPVKKGKVYTFPKLNAETFKGLPGMIADALPDSYGDKLLDYKFRSLGIKHQANIQLLKLCYISTKAIGALEYKPSFENEETKEVDLNDLVHHVDELNASKGKLEIGDLNKIQDIISVGSSLGGAAPKAVLGIDFNTNKIKPGNIKLPSNYDYWIIKFDALKNHDSIEFNEPKGFCNVEYVYHLLAIDAGLNMEACKLYKHGNRSHFLTKRFDRVHGEKIHMQSLHAMAHMDSYKKWDYDIYFKVLTRLKLNYSDHEEMFRRIVFNGLSGNTDTHTKNTSFLMDKKGNWMLSPLYDVICSVSLSSKVENHKTLINGKPNKFVKADYLAIAERNSIKHPEKIINQVVNSLNQWEKLSKEHSVKEEYRDHVSKIIKENIKNLGVNSQGV